MFSIYRPKLERQRDRQTSRHSDTQTHITVHYRTVKRSVAHAWAIIELVSPNDEPSVNIMSIVIVHNCQRTSLSKVTRSLGINVSPSVMCRFDHLSCVACERTLPRKASALAMHQSIIPRDTFRWKLENLSKVQRSLWYF